MVAWVLAIGILLVAGGWFFFRDSVIVSNTGQGPTDANGVSGSRNDGLNPGSGLVNVRGTLVQTTGKTGYSPPVGKINAATPPSLPPPTATSPVGPSSPLYTTRKGPGSF